MALTKIRQEQGVVINEGSTDVDFRIESNGNANMLFVDGGNDGVVIGSGGKGPALGGLNSSLQIIGSSQDNSSMALISTTNDADGANIVAGKGRSTNGGQGTIAAANDRVLNIRAAIDDGTNFAHEIGNIEFAVDTTPGENDTPGRIVFSTTADGASSSTEHMRITHAGTVLIGKTSPAFNTVGQEFRQGGATILGRSGAEALILNRTSSDGGILAFNRANTGVGSVSVNGSSTAFNTSSDYRLKENVDYIWDATTRLKQLKPARFNFITDADTTVDGFIAHEAQTVVPESVTGTKDAVDEDGVAVMQGIDNSKLVPLLVKTIQELEARLTALEAK